MLASVSYRVLTRNLEVNSQPLTVLVAGQLEDNRQLLTRFSTGLAAANLYPTPNRSDPVTNFVSAPLTDRQAGQFTIKTDHTIWHGSPLMFRYSFSRDNRDAFENFECSERDVSQVANRRPDQIEHGIKLPPLGEITDELDRGILDGKRNRLTFLGRGVIPDEEASIAINNPTTQELLSVRTLDSEVDSYAQVEFG